MTMKKINAFEQGEAIFVKNKSKSDQDYSIEDLQRKIGQLTMEIDFLKKVLEK